MWQTVRLGNENYYVSVQNDDRNRQFLVLTIVSKEIWTTEVSYDEIVNEMKVRTRISDCIHNGILYNYYTLFI